ncbi:hypothetical protein NBRC110019_31870 [Neptunitalea chrysea]|uniref:Mevalonate kinase n=1 Tax=Neptunitalea chrysea TaxID=1647581 RepID=A0A9W6B7U3_9FLAO|nr:GYDIA family GHMP kinase [Neptunitalea chrysea]GLB54146.1 hypothetical protein NBRC110019_31870 [Neptunitalea chrysea]
MIEYYSNGKLLITGEYGVLDGALSFAVPSKYGQNLVVQEADTMVLEWVSFDHTNHNWFTVVYNLKDLEVLNPLKAITNTSDEKIALVLLDILVAAKRMNPDFLNTGVTVNTQVTFPKEWGLGTSSTLINNIAQWAKVDAFRLLWESFKGSGYDIACAQHETPITYQIVNTVPVVMGKRFQPTFLDNLYFVYLNKKQDSKEGIAHYRALGASKSKMLAAQTEITKMLLEVTTLHEFEELLLRHETIVSNTLNIPKVKDLYFADYLGAVKSLGAWGGDFVLATGNEKTPEYFKSKGFEVVIPYADMVL